MLQGRRSIIRNIITKKVKAFRGQILPKPETRPNEIILPCTDSVHFTDCIDFSKAPLKLIDLESSDFSDRRSCFVHLGKKARLLAKRDPSINGASISAHDTVAFAKSDGMCVGLGELENKNADFDGDTESVFLITDPWAIDEIDVNMLPQNNLRIYQQNRISFTESHILFMHKRTFADDAFKHAKLYKAIRARETYKWLSRAQNRIALTTLSQRYPDYNFYK